MPTVPVYNTPQVRTEALRPAFQRDVDVSSGLQSVARGLGVAAENFDRIAERNAQTAADQADVRITTEWMKWDAENRKKYKGQNADGYTEAATEWWKNTADAYGKDLDPRAKELASRALMRKQAAALGNTAQYVNTEKERHAAEVYGANVATTVQFAVTSGDVKGGAEMIRDLAIKQGVVSGWTPEQVQAEQQKNLSAMHLAHITRLAESQPEKAQAYYDENKAEIGFAQQPRVEEVLRKEADNQFATQFAAQQSGKPLSEQLAAAGEIQNPERREKALLQIKNNYAVVKEAERERQTAVETKVWTEYVDKGRRVPETLRGQMSKDGIRELIAYERARAERLATGKSVKTDMATYIELREKLANGENVNLKAYTEKIAPAQMEQLLDIKGAAGKAGSKQDSMLTDEQRINTTLTGMGIDKTKDPETAGRFMTEVDRRVRAASAAKGDKPLTPDEKQKVIDSVAMDKVFVDEWGSDPEKPTALLKPDELPNAYVKVNGKNIKVSTVPATDRQQIIGALRQNGMLPTEQAIVEMYLMGQNKRATKGQVQK